MKKFVKPPQGTHVSNKCAVAAMAGNVPAIVVQDERGSQIVVTPKMARTLATELHNMAGIAERFRDPALSVLFPEDKPCPIL